MGDALEDGLWQRLQGQLRALEELEEQRPYFLAFCPYGSLAVQRGAA